MGSKCNNLNYLDYRYLQNCNESWYCIECFSAIFPFKSLFSNKNSLACCTSTDNNIQWIDSENDCSSSLPLKSSSNSELVVNYSLTMLSQKMMMTPQKIVYQNIVTLNKCKTLNKIPHTNKLLSLFYINTFL